MNKQANVVDEAIKLRLFLFSLKEGSLDWCGSIYQYLG